MSDRRLSGKGFGGRGTPVFDLDSVLLTRMMQELSDRLMASGDPEPFFTGCGVSPFITLKSECLAQYKILDKKVDAGSAFVITQLGYDINKFNELIRYHNEKNASIPVIASVYLLSPKAARAMNRGRVAGAYVSDTLYETVVQEWKNPKEGLSAATERAARLGVVLKAFGYRGIHIGGIHGNFKTIARILDRMKEIENDWPGYMSEFSSKEKSAYYVYDMVFEDKTVPASRLDLKERLVEHWPYKMLRFAHSLFFDKTARMAPSYRKLAAFLDSHNTSWILKRGLEDPMKIPLLSCQSCGDCGIQHAAFLCPESKCPKHTRNGPCGGSRNGACEVYPDKKCIWIRAYNRLNHAGKLPTFLKDKVPPRNWELNKTSSWINFHLNRDHQK